MSCSRTTCVLFINYLKWRHVGFIATIKVVIINMLTDKEGIYVNNVSINFNKYVSCISQQIIKIVGYRLEYLLRKKRYV